MADCFIARTVLHATSARGNTELLSLIISKIFWTDLLVTNLSNSNILLPRALLLLDALRVRLVDQQNVSGHALIFILIFIVVYEASTVRVRLNVIASHENAIAVLHVFDLPCPYAKRFVFGYRRIFPTRLHALLIVHV